MTFTQEKQHQKTHANIEQLIHQAIVKVGARKENDICRYLPMSTGGYIHHFTMRKMKGEAPEQLAALINKFIINVDKPQSVVPKQRAARGSRKPRDQFHLSKPDLDRLIHILRLSGDKEMVRKILPRKDLRTIKRELIASIRHNKVDQELWASYAEVVSHVNPTHTTQDFE